MPLYSRPRLQGGRALRLAAVVLSLLGGAESAALAGHGRSTAPGEAPTAGEVSVRVIPLDAASAGSRTRVLVGIKNNGGSRLLFSSTARDPASSAWISYSVSPVGTSTAGSEPVAPHPAEEQAPCPLAGQLLGVEPGEEIFRSAEILIPSDLGPTARKVRLTFKVELRTTSPDLACTGPKPPTVSATTELDLPLTRAAGFKRSQRPLRPERLRARLVAPREGRAGEPLVVLVGIRNPTKRRLLLSVGGAAGSAHWVRSYSYRPLDASGDAAIGGVGLPTVSSTHGSPDKICPWPDSVVALDPGRELMRAFEVHLPLKAPVGIVRLEASLELPTVPSGPGCSPLVLSTAQGSTKVTVLPALPR